MNLITLAPDFFSALFRHQLNVRQVFKDVLGLYGISHVAITHINEKNQLLTLSSTPSLEFNLFYSRLWRYDKTYHPSWYQQEKPASWQSLYTADRYDDLYFLKQVKHQYALGLSLPIKVNHAHFIYSIASKTIEKDNDTVFKDDHALLYKIGHYCNNKLLPLFL